MDRVICVVAALILAADIASAQAVADRFDYPVGYPNATGYYNALDFGVPKYKGSESRHLGEDWNDSRGGNSDLGAPVNAVANGMIIYAANAGEGWGNVIIILHTLPDATRVASMYAHLADMTRTSGTVSRAEEIGKIGRGYDYGGGIFDYSAHLHFEIRTDVSIGPGPGYSRSATGWTDPSVFIDARRSPTLQCATVRVPATAGGTDLRLADGTPPVNTGLTAGAGDRFTVTASGTLTIFGATPNLTNGPDGRSYREAASFQFLLPDNAAPSGESALSAGALIGKSGSSSYFYLGSSRQITAPRPGSLLLAINDISTFFYDNAGSFQVQVCRQ